MPPPLKNGRIVYIEIPALDIERSADFYGKVFGWNIKKRGDGSTAFDDTSGEVSGTWVIGRPASSEPGLLIYIVVDDMAATFDAVIRHGGEVVTIESEPLMLIGKFRDPGGNVIGLYQESRR